MDGWTDGQTDTRRQLIPALDSVRRAGKNDKYCETELECDDRAVKATLFVASRTKSDAVSENSQQTEGYRHRGYSSNCRRLQVVLFHT